MTPKQGHKAPESRDKEQRVNSQGIVKEKPAKKKEVKNEYYPKGYSKNVDPRQFLNAYFNRFPKDDEHEFNKI